MMTRSLVRDPCCVLEGLGIRLGSRVGCRDASTISLATDAFQRLDTLRVLNFYAHLKSSTILEQHDNGSHDAGTRMEQRQLSKKSI